MPMSLLKTSRLVVVVTGLLLLFSGGQEAFAQQLRKTCVDCHADMVAKFQQGVVHAPVREKKCDTCHLPHGIIGGTFLRQEKPDLCLRCHQAVAPDPGAVSSHEPVKKGNCSACHASHNSPHPRLLLKEQKELCYGCHDRTLFEKKNVHAPLSQGCAACHTPHKSKQPRLLVQEADSLCLKCHEGGKESMRKAHQGYLLKGNCLSCHSPHASDSKGLLKSVVHQPMVAGQCKRCHDGTGTDFVKPAQKADALCVQCHKKDQAMLAGQHQPVKEGKCTQCHSVHASGEPALLVLPAAALCLKCHTQGKKTAMQSVHAPVKKRRLPGLSPRARSE